MSLRPKALAGALGACLLVLAASASAAGPPVRDNPFALPDPVRYLSQIRAAPSNLVLQAIVSGDKRRWATINNRNYTEGDQVEDYTLLSIERDYVVLTDGVRRLELDLNRPGIPVRVARP